jgi:hypothetical protein
MFDSLDEQIRKEEDKASTPKQRMMRYVLYGVIGTAVFAGVVISMRWMGS